MTEQEIKQIISKLNIKPLAEHLGIRSQDRVRNINARLRTLFGHGKVRDDLPEFVAYIRVLSRNLARLADHIENTKTEKK